jgi:hypothetical protein
VFVCVIIATTFKSQKKGIAKSKAFQAISQAYNEINKFNAKQEKAQLEVKLAEKLELAKNDIMTTFNITPEKLDEIMKSESIRASLATILGKPAVQAKEGESGKSLVARKTRETNGVNISAEIRAMFDAGKSVDDVAAAGYDRKRASDIHWHWRKTQA